MKANNFLLFLFSIPFLYFESSITNFWVLVQESAQENSSNRKGRKNHLFHAVITVGNEFITSDSHDSNSFIITFDRGDTYEFPRDNSMLILKTSSSLFLN